MSASVYGKKALLTWKYFRNRLTKRPIAVNLEVTKRCNAKCGFCDYWRTKEEQALADYGPVVKKIDPMMVTITGGEPLLRRDIIEVVEGIRRAVPVTYRAMVTNGSLLTLEKAERLHEAGIDQIAISLDAVDERHDESRGIPGLWKRISTLLPQLPDVGFDAVTINWVIMADNFDQTLRVAELAREWGVYVSYSSYFPLKSLNNNGHMPTADKIDKIQATIEELLRFKRKNRNVRSSNYFLSHIPQYYRGVLIPDCPAGLKWIQISPEGYYKPCSELPALLHWTEYNHRTSFKPQACNICWYSCRGEVQAPLTPGRYREFL